MDVERFRRLPLMGILRGGSPEAAAPLVEALLAAGLETLEVAMNGPAAAETLAAVRRAAGGRLMVGAGTVVTSARLDQALEAGASFIVLPNLVAEVVGACRRRAIPVFPGALTPQEVHAAWAAGATMVKLFPAKFFGPDYVRELKGPFDEVELLACGGVTAANAGAFLAAGATALAFGGSVFSDRRLSQRDWTAIEQDARALVEAVRRALPSEGPGGTV